MRNTGSPEYLEFINLLQLNKRMIFNFVLAAVPQYSVAEDIMQDTIIRLWDKFPEFRQNGNFAAWGIGFAKYVVLEYQKKDRVPLVLFDSDALDNLCPISEKIEYDHRMEALHLCFERLPDIQKHILEMRYSENLAIREIALRIGKPIHGMYKAVTKIHFLLQQCIERAVQYGA